MRCPTYLAGPPRDENDSGRCRLVGLLLAAAVFGASGVAWADAVCGGYDDCLQRMTQAAVSKDYAAAQAAAEAALALRQEPVLLLNLGTFHERQQHSAEALDYYQRYLKNPGPELTPERRERLEGRMATLQQALASTHTASPRLGVRTYVGVPLAALGLGLLGTGAVALAAEGRCVDDARPCVQVYQGNLGIGLGLLLPGVAVLATGVTLFSLDLARRRKARGEGPAVLPVARGGLSSLR